MKRSKWRTIGYAVFIPLGVALSVDRLLQGDALRALAIAIQVGGAILSLPFAGLMRWPFSERSRIGSGLVAMAVFMVGKFLEWHLRSGLTYAIIGTLVLLGLAAAYWWVNRELRREQRASAN